jgi:hypothetical protein
MTAISTYRVAKREGEMGREESRNDEEPISDIWQTMTKYPRYRLILEKQITAITGIPQCRSKDFF